MAIPTEPIGSIPRPPELIAAAKLNAEGKLTQSAFDDLVQAATLDTIRRFEQTGSAVITDGEQGKPSFVTYPLAAAANLAPDGVTIPFADGHARQLPRLTAGPFRYSTFASAYLKRAKQLTALPVKQAVISASALSLLYPADGLPHYSREQFEADLVNQAETDIRQCLDAGADSVQIDFTEARLSLLLDPAAGLLQQFIDLNNRVLARFSAQERSSIGVHTCPGGDQDATHSAQVDYADLLPLLFSLHAGRFYIQLASESEPGRVLGMIQNHLRPDQSVFVGVVDPIDPRIESPEEIAARIGLAAAFIPPGRLGTTDDCGFAPFGDDASTSRDVAFAKVRARVEGTRLAERELGL